jgi:signal transduction histidine kinase
VRAAVVTFLARTTQRRPRSGGSPLADPGRVSLTLAVEPARDERLTVCGLDAARSADLEPQVEAVSALAGLALDRIHLLAELKREVERQAVEIAARAAGEQRALLARQVAHELRKPTEEIRDLASTTRGDRALARIEAVSHELLRRLDCLLAQGGPRLDPRPIDLVRVADEALSRVARLGGRRAVVVRHACTRLPLLADPVRIASLVENLLDNAWKATAAGGRVALRTAFVRRASGPRVVLEVEDDGPGIPSELGSEIFEPGIGRFRNGFGLGLPLCREIAAAHGGAIEVESAPGRTVFRVELPQLAEPGA